MIRPTVLFSLITFALIFGFAFSISGEPEMVNDRGVSAEGVMTPVVSTETKQRPDSSYALPSVFVADRILVEQVTVGRDTLRFLTDTGGGLFFLERAAEKLDLATIDTTMVQGRPTPLITPPEFGDGDPLPPIPLDEVPLFSSEGHPALLQVGDGLLGQAWFGDRIWTFDYGREEIRYLSSSDGLFEDRAHIVSLGFKVGEEGHRTNNFPSIEATVDGESYAFLFDTGASLVLTDSARAELEGPPVRGTSFISESVFEKWRSAHPEWRVIENADQFPGGMPVIEVPKVTIAGHSVGPVWFTKRPDANFHEFMSGMMDRHVEGALGGSLFRYFAITVDYPGARAAFKSVE